MLNAEVGINLCTLQLAEEGIDEDTGQLASGMIKAIRDILKELKIGKIKNFNTHEKQVIVYKKDAILTALVCDKHENAEIYNPKIRKITEMFNNAVDWDKWGGEMDIFNETIEKTKELVTFSEKEIIELLEKQLVKMVKNTEMYGFKIFHNSEIVIDYTAEIDNFELKSLFESNFYSMIKENLQDLEETLLKIGKTNVKKEFFVDYGKLSILIKSYLENLHIVLFLPGMLDPLLGLAKYEKKLQDLGEF
ncbi:MAG: hypothetical protein ACOC44_07280 [Promethearchaeia archaeon]